MIRPSNSNKKFNNPKVLDNYDPIKVLNKKGVLNDAAIKVRYDLMYLNNYYKNEGVKIHDNNLFMKNRGVCDKDIVEYKRYCWDFNYKELTTKAQVIRNNICNSEILKTLDSAKHSKPKHFNLKLRKMENSISNYKNENNKNDFNYKEFKLKERRKTNLENKQYYQPNISEEVTKENYFIQLPKPKLPKITVLKPPTPESTYPKFSKKKMVEYGKLPKFKRKSKILVDSNLQDDGSLDLDLNMDLNTIEYKHNETDKSIHYYNVEEDDDEKASIIKDKSLLDKSNVSNLPEFTNISLNSKSMVLIKNYIFPTSNSPRRQRNMNKLHNLYTRNRSVKMLNELIKMDTISPQNRNTSSKSKQIKKVSTFDQLLPLSYEEFDSNKQEVNNEIIKLPLIKNQHSKPNIFTGRTDKSNRVQINKVLNTNESNANINVLYRNNILITDQNKKKRLTFEEKKKIKLKKNLNKNYISLNSLAKKIDNEFNNFHSEVEKVEYVKDHDLYSDQGTAINDDDLETYKFLARKMVSFEE